MKILLLNQNWFAEELKAAGHEVLSCGLADGLDRKLPMTLQHINKVIEELAPFQPELIIWHDNSAPLMLLGFEETQIPTIFYSVDTHHHAYVHKYMSLVFDLTLVAQKDYFPKFTQLGVDPIWFPLWASRSAEVSTDKQHQAVFVGTMNPSLNPDRVNFFNQLKEKAPLHIGVGEWWKIFPFSEIVVNQTVKGDLNFRVFEAMISGSLLLTERAGNGLLELFQDKVHLVTYEKNNADDAANAIKELLSDKILCRKIASAGRAEVLQKHTSQARANTLLNLISTLKKRIYRPENRKYFAAAFVYSCLAATLEERDAATYARALLCSLTNAERALGNAENLNDEVACEVVYASIKYDLAFRSQAGAQLIDRLLSSYPACEVLRLAKIRTLLNSGNHSAALDMAKTFGVEDTNYIFSQAENIVTSILGARN